MCVYKYTLLTALLCRICCLKGEASNRVEVLGVVLSYAQRVE